ncbi:proteasome subunit beta type-11a [Astyanax mexicanus]|uniref:proteasome subunit beta type-11a n=1 Tax=Astyanax mexicanus TaxID=7994 RepID=UPI0020CAE6A2|nr:proteasome subunit beta type-11a [Astyanax mexicanus]
MALQDVCGFQETEWRHPASPAGAVLSVNPAGEIKAAWRDPFEKDVGSPLCFLLPPRQSQTRSARSSSLATVPRPFPLSHGTTTLGFVFQGGVIAAADTRASCAGLVECPLAQKVMPIHSHMVVTTSGSGADCMLWERILTREIRLYQLRHGRRLSVGASAKLLSFMLHPFKGTEVCVAATLCGWDEEETRPRKHSMKRKSDLDDKEMDSSASDLSTSWESWATPQQASGFLVGSKEVGGKPPQGQISEYGSTAVCRSGPRVCYVCSDGLVIKAEVISVGSGSPYAYSVLDDGWRWSMGVDEAVVLAREAVYRATHRDAYSGNNVDLFHITERGWSRRPREDLKEEYYRERRREKEAMQKREREKQEREGVILTKR